MIISFVDSINISNPSNILISISFGDITGLPAFVRGTTAKSSMTLSSAVEKHFHIVRKMDSNHTLYEDNVRNAVVKRSGFFK